MKKLSKLKLHNAVSLNDSQMKQIIGGYGEYTGYTGGSGGKPCNLPPKVCACINHKEGDPCSFVNSSGVTEYGKCGYTTYWDTVMHCSDLR
jgi:natural product precursor